MTQGRQHQPQVQRFWEEGRKGGEEEGEEWEEEGERGEGEVEGRKEKEVAVEVVEAGGEVPDHHFTSNPAQNCKQLTTRSEIVTYM